MASIIFYAWGEGFYVGLMILMIGINYLLGLWQGSGVSKLKLSLAIIANLIFLFYFKYFVFFITNLDKFGKLSLPIPDVHLPLGVSFVTFHLISYQFDIYRKVIKAEKTLLDFALYIFLFPHLIAGPIVRYIDIGKQVKQRVVTSEDFAIGIERFIVGLGKKVIIANVLATQVDKIFKIFPHQLSAEVLWFGLLLYTLQIYFDFSGYSDMAIGLARMFGFKFAENFNYPYIATSVQEFWRRWHMTLSSWFRDYVYIPLGGSREGQWRTVFNILVVFTLTGFWHGAAFNFIFWGLYYGVFLALERLFLAKVLNWLWKPYQHLYLLLVVMIGWLFFKVENLQYAIFLVKKLFFLEQPVGKAFTINTFLRLEVAISLIFALLFVTPFFINQFKKINITIFRSISLVGLLIIFIYSLMQLASGTYNPFIYFRF